MTRKEAKHIRTRCSLGCLNFKHLYAPKTAEIREIWRQQLNIEQFSKAQRICDNHFSDEMFAGQKKKYLTVTAIPMKREPQVTETDTTQIDTTPEQSGDFLFEQNCVETNKEKVTNETISNHIDQIIHENEKINMTSDTYNIHTKPIAVQNSNITKEDFTNTTSASREEKESFIIKTPREINLQESLRIAEEKIAKMRDTICLLEKTIEEKDAFILFLENQLAQKLLSHF